MHRSRAAAEQAQQKRLQQVNANDLAGTRAQALHDGDRIEPLFEVRMDRHGHAQRALAEIDLRPGPRLRAAGASLDG